jgi:D-cysteine desulfhydrase
VGWKSLFYKRDINLSLAYLHSQAEFPTPLRQYPRLSELLNVSLWVKHDDEYPGAGGGSKVRKLRTILVEAEREGCNAIVTTGGASSNHARAAALLAAARGWKAKVIIHEPEPTNWPANLQLVQLAGADLSFCDRSVLPTVMDDAMEELREAGLQPHYVWGGGHNAAGGRAYRDAAMELAEQCVKQKMRPDYILVASGTGTTQAGLQAGATEALSGTTVIGISVAHQYATGVHRVLEGLQMLEVEGEERIVFYDDFLAGGYGLSDSDQADSIRLAARTEGLLLDPIYSGKAFHGLRQLVRSGRIERGSNVVFWHTGGLINLISSSLCHPL